MKTTKRLVVAAVLGMALVGTPALADTSGSVAQDGVAVAQVQNEDDGGGSSGNWGLLGLLGLLGLAGLAGRKKHQVDPGRAMHDR
ncbi:WGxxGxxG family protein [Saccharothrix hoggarensis]|uniref:WGxxGxxG family protein n=1 Tax=Saccharothrix hoggarensis TaxID=913853 RepID=A0ABW3QXD9_9PSEU